MKELGGRRVYNTLAVDIEKVHGQSLYRNVVPVEIKK